MQTESKQTSWMLIAESEAGEPKHEQTILFKHTGMNNAGMNNAATVGVVPSFPHQNTREMAETL